MTTPPRPTHPRQRLLLAVAAGLIAVAVALVLVVTLRSGSDGPAAGSPEAVIDRLATALQQHAPARIAALACPGTANALARRTSNVLADTRAATRQGSADTHGTVGVARLALALSNASAVATVALQHPRGAGWCVAGFAVARPGR